MREIIEKQYNNLIVGLADLYVQKERIEDQIKAQKVAVEQCKYLIAKADGEKENV